MATPPDVTELDIDAVPASAFGLADELAPLVTDWHSHRKHQLLYAASGTLMLETESGRWWLPPQRAAWIRAGTSHRVSARRHVSLRTVYLAAKLTPGPVDPVRVFDVTPVAREMILHAMRWGADRRAKDALAELYFAALAGLCAEWSEQALPLHLPLAKTEELRRAMDYALDRLGAPLSLEKAAKHVGTSVRTLARRFEEETQMGWRRFLSVARVLKAMELLSMRGARVSQTAFAVGFESLGAFTRSFEAIAGERPKDFRRRVAESHPTRPKKS